jgi:hypothetical protein
VGQSVLTPAVNQAPHFRQIGDVPAFVGDGADDLACGCGASVLVRGHRPGTLLAIGIECAACGSVTATPGLGANQQVPFGVRAVERNRMPVPQPITLAPGMVLADRDELVRVDRLSAPRDIQAAPFDMSEATLAAARADYDRLSGGQFAAHRNAQPPDTDDANTDNAVAGLARLPLAWALAQLQPGVATKGWWCLDKEPDAVAAVQLGAFREFSQVWSGHPLFPAMAASAAGAGFSTHALAVFAAARCMAKDGNRIDFTPPGATAVLAPPGGDIALAPRSGVGQIDGFYIQTSPTERLPIHVRRFDRFDWPRRLAASPATARAAVIDALIATQTRINARQHGFLVLSVGSVVRSVDMPVIEGLQQTLQERGRRHRGLAGVALMLPKIYPTARSDQVAFGWIFLPYANPHFSHGNVQVGPSRNDVMRATPIA